MSQSAEKSYYQITVDHRLQNGNKGKEENGVSFSIKPHFLFLLFLFWSNWILNFLGKLCCH